jgi:hypothetical protein
MRIVSALNSFVHKYKKILIVFISTIVIIVVLAILFISPIAKYLIEKYDEKYTGREITMDWAYVNPFTGYIYLSNFKIHEFKDDTIFFSSNGVGANFALLKMFSETYEISELTLNRPCGIVIQNKKDFNFNDLIEKFSQKEGSDTTKEPVHFNILSVKIIDGEFHYRENITPINYFIKKVNIESSGLQWNADTIAAKFAFLSGMGSGDMEGNFTINFKNLDYRLAVVVQEFDLNILEQYLKDLSNDGSFSAILNADMKSKGNFDDQENVTMSGKFDISDFHFGKNPQDDYASFDKLMVAINEVSPKNHVYSYDSILLSHPYLKYERYDFLDNLQSMFGKGGANVSAVYSDPEKFNLIIEIANYVEVVSKNFFKSDYKINSLVIDKGHLKFNDYSLSEKFSIELNSLSAIADSIDKTHKWVTASLKSDIKPYGNLSVDIRINPKDSGDFDMQYNFQDLAISMFNPYVISYTSFPFDRGTIEINGKWNVRNGIIQSDNHLLIIDSRVTNRLKNKDTKWIPMPLVMAFVRDRGNVIDYEIPITGNLKDPKFHLRDVIFDLLENIFVKPATTPYRMQVKNKEAEIEKFLSLRWDMRNSSLLPQQDKFIEKMADFLAKNPDAFITVYPHLYTIKEKEYILFFEAKKKYFLAINNKNDQSFSEEDSRKVDKMSVKDSLFIRYLHKQINESGIFTIQEKCSKLIDSSIVNARFNQLNKEREIVLMAFFKKREVEKQVKVSVSQNFIPYNGFSFYKIEYRGEFPESLMKAYRQMDELNEEAPRKEFKNERKEYKSVL